VRQNIPKHGSIARFDTISTQSVTFSDESVDNDSLVPVLRRAVSQYPRDQAFTYAVFLTSACHYVAVGPEGVLPRIRAIEASIDAARHVVAPHPLVLILPADLIFPTEEVRQSFTEVLVQRGIWHLNVPYGREQLMHQTASQKFTCALIHQYCTFVYIRHLERELTLADNLIHYAVFNIFYVAQEVRARGLRPVRANALTDKLPTDALQELVLGLNALTVAEKIHGGEDHVNQLVTRVGRLLIDSSEHLEIVARGPDEPVRAENLEHFRPESLIE
jgi:hypothetical protein